MANEPTKEGAEGASSKPLVEVKANVFNLELQGLDKFERVASNIVEALKRGIGSLYEPTGRIRDAKADRLVAIERAQTMIDLTTKAGELADLRTRLGFKPDELRSSQAARAIEYCLEDFSRKQDNREKTAQAFVLASNAEEPTEDAGKNIDQDWLTRFWTLAESISNEELRGFLARLLTKETRKPGVVSPLTLNTLSTLTPQVAVCFERFCRLSMLEGDEAFVIHPNVFSFQHIGPLEDYGISYSDLYELESFGLIRSAQTIMLNYAADQVALAVDYAGTPATINLSGLQLHLIYLTRAGRELRALLHLMPVPEYTQALQKKLKAAFIIR
jgi:hypothetical protein